MPERMKPSPEAAMETKEVSESSIEKVKRIYKDLKEVAVDLKDDDAVIEGVEASARTVINSLITVADTIPGVGEAASWGADAAKIWARIERQKKIELKINELVTQGMTEKEAREKAKKLVPLSKIDLTPDASVAMAVVTELGEIVTGGIAPSHIVETGIQLAHDRKKLVAAYRRLREYFSNRIKVNQDVAEASQVFDVSYEEVE